MKTTSESPGAPRTLSMPNLLRILKRAGLFEPSRTRRPSAIRDAARRQARYEFEPQLREAIGEATIQSPFAQPRF